jgi:hypothetical protein
LSGEVTLMKLVSTLLVLCATLWQVSGEQVKQLIDNEDVTAWDVDGATTARPGDTVIVSLAGAGSASFVPKGTAPSVTGRCVVIDLKNHASTPLPNPTNYPLAFPRPGVKKVLENDKVIVWDYTWAPGVATPMHFHDKDVVVVYFDDGDLRSTSVDGNVVTNSYKFGMVTFNRRNRTHTETLVRGKQRAIITELK